MAGLKVKIGADASQFERTMRGVTRQVGGVKSSILGIAGATGAILAVNKAFDGMRVAARGAFEFIKESSREAASIESLTMQFRTMLGSAGAAKKRIEEITKFAATTPFEIKELAATSKLLQNLGGTMLATGDGLKMVGDAAAIAGQPIGEVGLHIGRLFSAITSGTSAGESVNRLQEIGLIGGDVKMAFEDLAKAQKKGTVEVMSQSEALKHLQGILSGTEGAMERLAQTTEGKLSNLRDNIDQLQVAFGTGFNVGLKDALDATNQFLPQFHDKMTEAGQVIGTAISQAVQGDLKMFHAMGEIIVDSIGLGMTQSLRILQRNFYAGLEEINPLRKIPGISGRRRGSETVEGLRMQELEEHNLRIQQKMDFLREENRRANIAPSPNMFSQVQGMIGQGMSMAGGIPQITSDPFSHGDQQVAILKQIERHLSGAKMTN